MTAKEKLLKKVEQDRSQRGASAKELLQRKVEQDRAARAQGKEMPAPQSGMASIKYNGALLKNANKAPVGAADTYTRAEEGKRLKAERDKAEQELYTSGGQREYEDRLRAADAEWQSWWNANPDLHDKIGEKLTVGENLDYLAGRALKGFGGAVQGTIGFVDKLVGDDLAILGSLVDATTGGKTQIEKPIQKWADNALEADILGAEKFGQGVEGSIAGAKPSAARDFIGGISESAGAMLPAIATGGAASAAGLGAGTTQALNYLVFGSGAAGNAAKEAINNGASADEAVQYGLYSGMLEVLSESMFAGITGMNPSGALDDILKKLNDNGTIKFLTDTIGEGVEEGIVTFLTPYIARATYNPQAASATWKEMMQAISSGAAMSLLMNSAAAITSGSPEALISSTKGMTEQQVLQDKYGRVEEETVADVFRNGTVTPVKKPAVPAQEEVKEPTAKERLLAAVEADKVKAEAAEAKEAEEEIPRMELKGIEDETEPDTQPDVQSARATKPAPTGTATEKQRMQARAIGDMVEAGAAAKASPAALGIENGGDIESITVLEEPLTKMFDFSEASKIAERAGYEPVYFSGMLQNSNGGTSRWGIAGNKLYIQADSANYTTADIAKEAVETGNMPAAPVEAEIKPAKRPRKTISIYDGGIDSEDQYTKEYIASGRISESDLQTISDTAKALGLKVRFANSLMEGKVGAQIENGIVTISASSSKPLRRLFGHEITHRLQELAPAAYNQMRSIIQNSADSKTKVRRIIETYEAQDLSISELDALDEVVADYAGSLLEDEGALEQLINKADKTLIEKLREVFRALADKLTGRQKTQAERVYEKLAEAMENASGRVSNYQTNGGKKVSPDINPGFAEARFSVEPPYRKGTNAEEQFVSELDSKAKQTYQLFKDINTIGEQYKATITVGVGAAAHPKKINITKRYMVASLWNEYCDSSKEFAETAQMLAELLPDTVKRNANIRDDGKIEETPFEAEFKMERAFIQRIVDALPMEVIDSTVVSNGKEIKVSNKNKVLNIGGEAYRRALVEERRAMYREGRLPTRAIGGLSKDKWGAMGFLATNGKTGASGDFTTLCPQMYFNKGCFYCYRRAALTSGLNNKLTGETVWYTGEILQLRKKDVKMLNENGGLRIQSFGDWMEQYSAQLADLLMDAEEVGLQIKIITKEPSMIETVALLKEQGIGNNLYFNLSADYVIEEQGEINNRDSDGALPRNPDRPFMKRDGKTYWKRALTVEEAAEYRSKYDWVNTRIVATTLDEFIEGLRSPYVDVVTGYHGSLREYERVSSATGETLVDVEPLGDAGMPRFAFIRGKWQLEYEGKTKTHKKLAQAIEDAGLQWEYYIKSCCITGRCATCKGKCGKLANIFGVKNATNRDAESLAYWQEQMDSAADNPLLVSQMEETSGVKYSLEERDEYAPMFYSKMEREIEAIKQNKLSATSVISMLRGKGVKAEEIKWSGIETFLEGKKSVTKEELLEFVQNNQMEIEEEELSDAGDNLALTDEDLERLDELEDEADDLWSEAYDLWGEVFNEEMPDGFKLSNSPTDYVAARLDRRNLWREDGAQELYSVARKLETNATWHEYILEEARRNNNESAKWSEYKLNGGSNYREYLFKVPGSDYTNEAMEVHWGNKPGVLAHARVQDFDTANGKMLFIEEIQSDWHNAGRKFGYKNEAGIAKLKLLEQEANELKSQADILWNQQRELEKQWEETQQDEQLKQWQDAEEEWYRAARQFEGAHTKLDEAESEFENLAPNSPYSKTYHEFVLKSLLRKAAAENYSSIGWITGKMQEKRWSSIFAEGYRIEYDQDIPKFLNKYGKQWGASVSKTNIETGSTDTDGNPKFNGENYTEEVWMMPITESMKNSVLYEGQPRYSVEDTDNKLDNEMESILSELQAATADEVVERKIAEAKAEAAEENAPELLAEKMSNSRGEFSGSAALEKLGIKVVNSIGKYSNVKQLLGNARAGRSITRERKKAEIRLKVTAKEKNFARGIANGIYTESDIPEGWDKRTVMEMSEWYMAERNFGESYIDLLKQAITVDVDAATAQMFEGADESKVPPAIVLNHRTAQRNMLNIFGDKGKEINKWLFDPVNQNEAERIRFINRQFDQVRTFADQTGKQRALNKAEREMVQRVIEGCVVEDALAKLENRKDIETAADSLRKGEDIGDIGLEFGLTLEEQEIVESLVKWQDVQDQLEAMDKVIIYNAVDKYSALFDSYYEAINDFLAAHGYQPIGFIKGYVPHLQPEENQTALQNVFQKLGLNTDVSSLPTSIAGLTGDYKPNKKWNPYFLHRNSTVTQFDIVEAFESYVSNMADVLYHADDIMRIRSAVKYFRRTYSPEEIRNSIEWAENLRTMPKDEKISFLYDEGIITSGAGLSHADAKDMLNKYIEEQYGKIENTSKFNNLVTYLENYANILAGKQSIADRGSEYSLGRKILNAGNKLTRIFSRANVAGNFSSALNQSAQLPTILSENGLRNTSAAFKDIITGNLRKASWAEDSDFLTGKRGVSFIVNTPGEMVIDALFKPLEIVDSLMSTMAVRGAYLDGIKQGMSHEAAMQYADKKAAAIMGNRTKGAKPLAFEAKNPISSMVHLFQVEALNSWDHIVSDLPQDFKTIAAVQGKRKAAQALAGVISKMLVYSFVLNRLAEKLYGGTPAPFDIFGLTANFIASGQELSTNAYLEALIDKVMLELFGMELFGSDEDERMQLSDGEFEWETAAEDLGYNISNELPFLNNLSALLGLGDKTLPLPDLITPLEGVYEGIKNKSVTEALDSALQLVGEIAPAGRQVVKTYTGAKMIAQGGKMKGFGEDARLQYPVRRTAGNITQALLFGASGLQENQDFYASGRTALTTKETTLWKTLVANGADEEDAYNAIYSTKGEDVKTYEKLLMMAAPLEWSNGLKYDAMAGVTSDSFGYKLNVLESNDIDALKYAEVTAEMYDLAAARIADLPEEDRPETVTISQEDAEKALKALSLSKQEKAIIWQMTNAGWSEKSNPFSNSIGKRVKAEYKEIKEQAEEEKRKEEEEDEIPRMELRGLD